MLFRSLADASLEATAAETLGLAQAAITNNTNGTVIAVGELTGLDTSALTEGAIIWLSETTGALTTTRPTQPAHGVVLGYCVKSGPGTSGIVYIKVDNGLELDELHDVLIVSATTDQALMKAADGLWKNKTITPALIGAATAAQGALADSAVQPAALSSYLTTAAAATTYQPLDADLTSIAALTTTTFGRSLLTQADAAAARTTLGAGTGNGTVTSVGLSLPGIFSVTGSPVTTAGTLAATLATQAANLVFAGPSSGAAATPAFRQLGYSELSGLPTLGVDPAELKRCCAARADDNRGRGCPAGIDPPRADRLGVARAGRRLGRCLVARGFEIAEIGRLTGIAHGCPCCEGPAPGLRVRNTGRAGPVGLALTRERKRRAVACLWIGSNAV